MQFTETAVSGAYVIELSQRGDDRGFFARLWCSDELEQRGLESAFVQCNTSFSLHAGTLRGLHYQIAPHEEVKLVRCTRGRVFDVALDLRPESSTYGRWIGVELTADNRRMLYVPRGCAHGYLTLEGASEVEYPVSHRYTPAAERGIRWDDGHFNIAWPSVAALTISPKDREWPDYQP